MTDMQRQLDDALKEMEIEDVQAATALLRELREGGLDEFGGFGAGHNRYVEDSWGFPPDRDSMASTYDTGQWGGRGILNNRFYRQYNTLDDHQDGRYLPYYVDETDLQEQRARARRLGTFSAHSIGAMDAMNQYTMAGEWNYQAVANDNLDDEELVAAKPIVNQVQRVIDDFLDRNEWMGDCDSEIHDDSREDGETFVGLYGNSWHTRAAIIEPEYCTEPSDGSSFDHWLGIDQPTRWDFGVHVKYDSQMKRYDRAHPLGYYFVFDNIRKDFDYLPSWPMPHLQDDQKCCYHIKRNVRKCAPRGVSDYKPVWEDLEGHTKLKRRIRGGASAQAAILWIIEGAVGQTRAEAVSDSRVGEVFRAMRAGAGGTGTDSVSYRDIPDQAVIRTKGQKFHTGPMGSLNQPVFMEVARFVRQSISVRWQMPEYLFSGDASNSNFASTLVSGDPFVKARERDQSWYGRRFRAILFRAVKIALNAGFFDGIADWQTLRRLVDISVTGPRVSTRDPLANTQRNQILHEKKLLTAEDWAIDEKLDPSKVGGGETGTLPDLPTGGETTPAAEFAQLTTEEVRELQEQAALEVQGRLWQDWP